MYLLVCIDGTSNNFGTRVSFCWPLNDIVHVIEGHASWLTFYNSGIGMYAKPSWKLLSYFEQVIVSNFDLMLALRFETILLDAYCWLSEMYKPGDCIFLFGAYQVHTLAGMIEKVRGAKSPYAYELYAQFTDSQPPEPKEDSREYMPWRFKNTFSRKNVKVHFVGAWDTVLSIGFVRPTKDLPLTTSGMKHVCYFRHALALDERRVKFLPEYIYGGASQPKETPEDDPGAVDTKKISSLSSERPKIKEVWFAGTFRHNGLTSYGPALQWMILEAILAGLHVEPLSPSTGKANAAKNINESLTGVWWIFEVFPIRWLSYKDSKDTTHCPHMGAPRQVVEGQWIHELAYLDTVPFKAHLPSNWQENTKIEKDLYNRVQGNLMPLSTFAEASNQGRTLHFQFKCSG
ncbi:hypothetical protein BT96DRAFT_825032 [Gymnopus androsaceus JB14]|uniref:T6SS Phospholipase effector Tle1-like catalytic domain-containing protein n=1 Tax=Gymnopus androsaceus JB14 TaxID=1447944 RepID=A0A6A4HEI5_9AGAR|nr:hypothetical protein BT96DRAFT_825032 [Gymnopus androsaceus JB14]